MTTVGLVALGIAALVLAVLLWAFLEGYLVDVQAHEVPLADLPEGWDGRRVALIADLQVGMWLANRRTIARIVRRIVRERPDVVLIAGDFVYDASDKPEAVRDAARLVAPLASAGLPTYAVLGNHDYAMPGKDAPKDAALAEEVRRAVEAVGIRVLENEAVVLPNPSSADPLYLVGLGAHVPGHDSPEAAFADVPSDAARIVMMHHPNSFEILPRGAAPLAVAGHTHGGQFQVPFTPDWTWMTYTRDDRVHTDGFAGGYGERGNLLYVNRGIGFSVVPLRLNCPPELTLFRLRRVESHAHSR